MEYIEYTTKDGDRWDLLAYEYYGDSAKYEPIILANPLAPIMPILPAGLTLQIPLIEDETEESEENLPPWKLP